MADLPFDPDDDAAVRAVLTERRAELQALAPLVEWTGEMQGFWERKLDGLEDLLGRMDQ